MATRRKQRPVVIQGGLAYEGERVYRLHPTARCPRCDARLMLGDPYRGGWHCTNLDIDSGDEWLRHFEVSRDEGRNA